MAPVAQRRLARIDDDDDDFFDSEIYDPAFYPRKVVRDGKGIRVRAFLMDGMPPNAASMHRPHQIVSDSAELRDAEREAARAYDERNDFLRDAWRSRDNPPPPPLRDGQTARDQYIERTVNAWRTATCRNDPADDVEALQRRWASPGAMPGPGRRPTQDAAASRAEADQAYAEYCARLQSAWKTR